MADHEPDPSATATAAPGILVLDQVTTVLADDYYVAHSTIQCEPAVHTDRESPV